MTYIADVVSGIISSIRFFDNKFDHEIFNIGNNNPVKTIEVINKIEKEFSMKANIEYVQRNSEVQITNADCTKSKLLLKYQPKICINKGLNLFFKWFREYHDV